jgi:hypothetical protein
MPRFCDQTEAGRDDGAVGICNGHGLLVIVGIGQ